MEEVKIFDPLLCFDCGLKYGKPYANYLSKEFRKCHDCGEHKPVIFASWFGDTQKTYKEKLRERHEFLKAEIERVEKLTVLECSRIMGVSEPDQPKFLLAPAFIKWGKVGYKISTDLFNTLESAKRCLGDNFVLWPAIPNKEGFYEIPS